MHMRDIDIKKICKKEKRKVGGKKGKGERKEGRGIKIKEKVKRKRKHKRTQDQKNGEKTKGKFLPIVISR